MTDTAINLDWASPHMRRILGRLLDGGELSVADGLRLAEVSGLLPSSGAATQYWSVPVPVAKSSE